MKRAVLEIDMPNCCEDCVLYNGGLRKCESKNSWYDTWDYNFDDGKDASNSRPSWCMLQPLDDGKALLEIDVPKACFMCELYSYKKCKATNEPIEIDDEMIEKQRSCRCPLKEIQNDN